VELEVELVGVMMNWYILSHFFHILWNLLLWNIFTRQSSEFNEKSGQETKGEMSLLKLHWFD